MVKLISYKVCSLLFIILLGLLINCQTKQVSENTPNNTNQQTSESDISDEKIKELFVDSGLGKGDGKLEELMTFPKERIIAVVQKTKENGDKYLKLKSAYFLWELGVEREANEKYVVDLANKKNSVEFYAEEYLGVFISEGKKEYLPIIFEDALEWKYASLYIQSFLLDELETSPKTFLFYLSKEPLAIRKRIYEVTVSDTEFFDAKRFEKIKANIKKLKPDKEIKNIVAEFLSEVNKK